MWDCQHENLNELLAHKNRLVLTLGMFLHRIITSYNDVTYKTTYELMKTSKMVPSWAVSVTCCCADTYRDRTSMKFNISTASLIYFFCITTWTNKWGYEMHLIVLKLVTRWLRNAGGGQGLMVFILADGAQMLVEQHGSSVLSPFYVEAGTKVYYMLFFKKSQLDSTWILYWFWDSFQAVTLPVWITTRRCCLFPSFRDTSFAFFCQ